MTAWLALAPTPPPGSHGEQFGGGVALAVIILVVIWACGSGRR